MLIKINLIFEGVFCIVTCISTLKSMGLPFKHVLMQETRETEETTTQKHAQMHFSAPRLTYVMMRAHMHKHISTASNTLVSASRLSIGAKI